MLTSFSVLLFILALFAALIYIRAREPDFYALISRLVLSAFTLPPLSP